MHNNLFQPISLGALELKNSIIMAPMTRDRAGPGDVPSDIMIEYYRQRASAGLIVTEGTQPSREGKGYWRTPGIYSQEQIDGWAKVADAVHGEGGKIVMQIMHCGRVVVPDNRGYIADVIAPSAISCSDPVPGPDGVPAPTAMPRALAADELPALAEEFAQAARNARAANIDGVELHCASGYLINQFLNPVSNLRDDNWGEGAAGRVRFPVMVLDAMAKAIGGDRVGFRISPGNPYNDMDVSDPEEIFVPLLNATDELNLAYVHVVDMGLENLDTLAMIRQHWSGKIVTNNSLNAETASEIIQSGRADAVSFGRAFIANPDLVNRILSGAKLAKPDYAKLYTGEREGYIDYPVATIK
ncbi:alkene reductase [Parasphingorhabdus halotolerans]|nr:alkene reductase [Parasphingorhabdus halotolerans]